MAERNRLFGKYYYTPSLQTLFRKGYTKEEARKVFEALGCGDVAENTIKTQFTDYKNPKYTKEDVPFTPDEWSHLEAARNGGANESAVRNGYSADYEELLTVKAFAETVGGVERLKRLCEVILKLQ